MRKLIFSLIATLMLPLGMSAQAYTQSKYYNPQTGHLDYNENRPSRMYEAGKRYYGLRIGPSFSVVNSDDKALDGGKWQTGLNIGAVVDNRSPTAHRSSLRRACSTPRKAARPLIRTRR